MSKEGEGLIQESHNCPVHGKEWLSISVVDGIVVKQCTTRYCNHIVEYPDMRKHSRKVAFERRMTDLQRNGY